MAPDILFRLGGLLLKPSTVSVLEQVFLTFWLKTAKKVEP